MKTHRTTLQLTLLVMAILALAAGFVLTNHPAAVSANGGDLDKALAKFPSLLGTRLDSCNLCHTSGSSLNPFGSAYRSNGRNANAFSAIEGLDSDRDGFTNLQEITALTFPGNANDKPASVPTSTPTRQPTNTPTRAATNTPTRIPTNTPTQAPTNTPTRAPTNTPTNAPTTAPTAAPTATQTNSPTQIPTNTAAPTQSPTSTPTQPPVPTATATNPPSPTQTAVPGTLILNPLADTYVSREAQGRRIGKSDTLLVNSKPQTVSFLRFEMRELDDGEKVTKAVLRLYANTSSTTGISVFRAGGGKWDENITSEKAPKFGGRSVRMRNIDGGKWVEIDVTALVRGKKSVNLALTTGGLQASFASRETGDHAPQLVITVEEHEDQDEDEDHDEDDEGEDEDDEEDDDD